MTAQEIAKKFVPLRARDWVRRKRIGPVIRTLYRRELTGFIESSNVLSEEKLAITMSRHGLKNRWAGVYTLLNGIPSRDYVPEDFFHIHILPRMNNLSFALGYQDKNGYDATLIKKYTIPALARKIEGRYFDARYNPATLEELQKTMEQETGDVVIKPALESGSGKDVWIGPAREAFSEFSRRRARDIVVQKKALGDEFSRTLNPDSFNTVRVMTAYTGSAYVTLAAALRMGRNGSKVDNQNAGGLVLALRENGALCEFGYDKYLNRHDRHPDTGVVFDGKILPGLETICGACTESHRYLPHCGLVSWDAALDHEGHPRIVELNIDWPGINLFQSSLGPLFGPYKDEIKKTYGIPDWEGQ